MGSRNIRVLALLEAYTVSGSAKAVLEFAKEALDRTDIQVSIATFSRDQPETRLTAAVRETGIPLDIVSEKGRFDRSVLPQLHALVSAQKPHIVWSNSVKSHFLVRWAGLHRRAKWAAFHHGYTTTDLKMRAYNQLDRWSLRAADHVMTVCQPFAQQLQKKQIRPERISVHHMPIRAFPAVPPAVSSGLRLQLGLDRGSPVLLSVGRLSLEKGHADLIRAFRLVYAADTTRSTRLVLVGDGPERSNIERLCRELDLTEAVILAGHRDDVDVFYSIADVFVLPSHSEGSPNVLLESMAAGVPVIATRVGGVPELVTHEQDAILTPQCNVPALAQAMSRLLSDGPLRGRLAQAGRAVEFRNTPGAYYGALFTVFEGVLRNGRRLQDS